MKNTYALIVRTECWPTPHIEELHGFENKLQARREGEKILAALNTDSLDKYLTTARVIEIRATSNPFRTD